MKKTKSTSKFSPFDSPEEERAWRHKSMLTVQKLIDWLKKQDPDALIYSMEPNTGDYQEIPPDLPNAYVSTVKETKKKTKDHLKNWYKHSKDGNKKAQADFDDIFKYTEDNGVILH